MKLIYIFLFTSTLLIHLHAKNIGESVHPIDKRFLSQIGDWFNQNVIQPVITNSIVNDYLINPITTATNSITSWLTSEQTTAMLNDYINWLNQNVINPVTGAANWTVEQLTNGFYWTVETFSGTSTDIPKEVDPCNYTCFNRVVNNNTVIDYVYDKPNGCMSKGLLNTDLNEFNDCCDEHNKCLNSQCCTTNCEELKETCDLEFLTCLNSQCKNYDKNEEKLRCYSSAIKLHNSITDKKCKKDLNKNRKICLC